MLVIEALSGASGLQNLSNERQGICRHQTAIDTIDGGTGENLAEFTVPPGYYFILGDHRDHQENALSGPGHGLIARNQLFGILSYRYFRGYDRKVELELIP